MSREQRTASKRASKVRERSKALDGAQLNIERLERQLEVATAKIRSLQGHIEKMVLGQQPAWDEFAPCRSVISSDGKIMDASETDLPGTRPEVFINSRYQVCRYAPQECPGVGRVVHLTIKRIDAAACRDWRDFQRIKNELVGKEYDAVEIYPCDAKLVDAANQFHVWAFIDGKLPFGFQERLVSESLSSGVSQRAFDPSDKPEGMADAGELIKQTEKMLQERWKTSGTI